MTLKINQIKNKRIVVLGKSGIVASNLLFKLDKFNLKNIPIGRSKVNLKQNHRKTIGKPKENNRNTIGKL